MKRRVFPPSSSRLAVGDRPDPGRVEAEVVDEHGLGRLGREKPGLRIALEDPGQAARMVLFGVVGDEVVDLRDVLQVGLEDMELLAGSTASMRAVLSRPRTRYAL